MYSGDEYYDDDITSGPWPDLDAAEENDHWYNVPWSTYEEYVEYNKSVLKG